MRCWSPEGLNMRFVAIDFETFDEQRDSACAVGLVEVDGGEVVGRHHMLIRPPRPTPGLVNASLHGITWKRLADEPTFREMWPRINRVLAGADFMVAHYAAFDMSVLTKSCVAAGLRLPSLPMRCTWKLARKVWALPSSGLANVCRHLGIGLRHHHPLSDAEACARIVLEGAPWIREAALSW